MDEVKIEDRIVGDDDELSAMAIDWSKLKLPTPRNSRPQLGELGTMDYWKVLVASKLTKKSLAATLQTAVLIYLKRSWDSHEQRLIIEANKENVSPEEMFMRLVKEEQPDGKK